MQADSRSGYNQLKKQVLSLLGDDGALDSREIAKRLRSVLWRSVSLRSVEMALLRYHRQGLLTRTGKRGAYVYVLSDKGRRRLDWLCGLGV